MSITPGTLITTLILGVTLLVTPVGVKEYTKAQDEALWQREKKIMEGELPKHITYYEGRSPRLFLQELDAIANWFVITDHEMATQVPTRARVMKLRWELHNSRSLNSAIDFSIEEKILLDNILWTWEECDFTIIDSQHDAISILQQKWSNEKNKMYDGQHGFSKGIRNENTVDWEPMHNKEVPKYQQ